MNNMNLPASNKEIITIDGIVEKIVYINEENCYTVAVIQEIPSQCNTTIVGNFTSITPGETLRLKGKLVSDKKYGNQFKVDEYKSIVPSTVYAIRKYLGSGLIKGIGEKFAERIVNRFGKDTLKIIENNVNQLSEVEGLGKKRILFIQKAWCEQKDIREIMIFLQGCGVGCSNAVKIYKEYGNESISVLKKNPYRLAMDITGIGFKTADNIAQRIGIPFNSSIRVEAGVVFLLYEFANDGNVYCPYEELIKNGINILGVKSEEIANAVEELKKAGIIVLENDNGTPVYLKNYYQAEVGVCKKLIQIAISQVRFPDIIIDKAIDWVSNRLSISLSGKQKEAVRSVIENKVTVITGGPGVGKTTIINSIIKILEAKGLRILLSAPTGRAAKKLSETTGKIAMTIHRLLKFNPHKRRFEFNENNLLDADVFIVDEVSMIDVNLMHYLLKAIPLNAKLILVGDIDQLPSVGPGNVLKDIINSGVIITIKLTEIFRQSEQSLIVENAHRINNGELPEFCSALTDANTINKNLIKRLIQTDTVFQSNQYETDITNTQENNKKISAKLSEVFQNDSDFYFIEINDPKEISSTIKYLCRYEIPKKFGFNPLGEIQVLTPMHKGDIGTSALNTMLQETLNPQQEYIVGFAKKFCKNDKVMQIKNNYDKDVFNGDMGKISKIDKINGKVSVEFDGRNISYELSELDELVLSYAVTIHKSQGNEYPAVVIPVSTQHFIMLQRNLIYTAVTRGKKLVVIVGSKKAIGIAIANNKISNRYTGLKEKLEKLNSLQTRI